MAPSRFPAFGRMRKDFELMRQTCIAAHWLLEAIDSDSKDEKHLYRRISELRELVCALRGHQTPERPRLPEWKTPRLSYAGRVLHDMELAHADGQGEDDARAVRCGMACFGCQAFYTMTGWGEPWHHPDCALAVVA